MYMLAVQGGWLWEVGDEELFSYVEVADRSNKLHTAFIYVS